MSIRSRKLFLSFILLILSSTATFTQQPAAASNTSETRARNLTEALVADALALNRSERAILYARLGRAWSKHDPQLARNWFIRAVDTVEAPPVGKADEICQRTAARTLLGFVADRDKALSDRLIALIETSKLEQNQDSRLENAHALANAGISIANSNPKAARLLAEKSLALEFSYRIATLLWRIQKSDANEGDKLFLHILRLAEAGADHNLFSMLSVAVLNGPFASDKYRSGLVRSLVAVIVRKDQATRNEVLFCNPVPLLPPLLPDFDRFLPEFSQRARAVISRCERARNTAGNVDHDQPETAPRTIDEFLQAARDTADPLTRTRYLAQAVQLAAGKKDFDRALSILDSMSHEERDFWRDAWDSYRWDHAASAACAYRSKDDLQNMNKVIDNTPPQLRAFVRIALANCEAANNQDEMLNLLDVARKELDKADPLKQPIWYMSLVRAYIKHSPATAPEVFSRAVVAINSATKDGKDECPTSTVAPTPLSNEVLLNQYRLPVSLIDADEAGLLATINSVKPADIRAALRLHLLTETLNQHVIPQIGKPRSPGTP